MIEGTCIVTGATGGIGRAITEGLLERGAKRVILACRNEDKCRRMIESMGECRDALEFMSLDLESFASVRRFAESCALRGMTVTALFNNAGTMPGGVKMTEDGFESATQTNFLSTGLLTDLLLPLMPRGAAVVFTTSMTRRIVNLCEDWRQRSVERHGRFTTYGRSKLMLTHYALDLSLRLAERGITVNCSDPGVVDSAIITMGNPIVDKLSDMIVRPLISTPEEGAAPALEAVKSPFTGRIFTQGGNKPIPVNYQRNSLHAIPSAVIRGLSGALGA
ncbi:MAG: SDR family NAD(P)-dependent oxidoreductase [Lachnospiraceae bacterium]|nr:SDR family NAD(P)-dependent oxidoreductase [Lachnospiraceae bacterium]